MEREILDLLDIIESRKDIHLPFSKFNRLSKDNAWLEIFTEYTSRGFNFIQNRDAKWLRETKWPSLVRIAKVRLYCTGWLKMDFYRF